MEPAAARRRPTDVVAAARPGRAARARAAASGTAARGGRRRPSFLFDVFFGSAACRAAEFLDFCGAVLFFVCSVVDGV